jgi:hypothetical protein
VHSQVQLNLSRSELLQNVSTPDGEDYSARIHFCVRVWTAANKKIDTGANDDGHLVHKDVEKWRLYVQEKGQDSRAETGPTDGARGNRPSLEGCPL